MTALLFTDRLFLIFCYFVVALIVIACIYPLWLVIIYSISDPDKVNAGKVFLLPSGFNLDGYKQVFRHKDLMTGYWNTITQTLVGLVVNMSLTIPAAYALSKPNLNGRKFFMTLIVITMYFSGGLIPTCAVTGEAAGLALAMSSDLSKLSVDGLQQRLRQNGVKLHIDEVL